MADVLEILDITQFPKDVQTVIEGIAEIEKKIEEASGKVLMVQVENEPGAWGSVRDYSPAAQRVFEGDVPPEALAAMQKPTDQPAANWRAVFGEDADEFFQV